MKTAIFNNLVELDYACKEAMNTLCTNFSFAGRNVKKVVMTSCQPGEGKSFVTINLMRTLAELGKNVVVVDADMRRSVLIPQYEIQVDSKPRGLAHYLAEQCGLDDIVYKTNIDGAYMVFHGQDVVNSLALLTTPRLRQLLDELANAFDVVLIDSPPIGLIIDAAEIARSCDGVVFVVSNNTIARRELLDARVQMEKAGCNILGAVLNKVTFDTHSAKKHYYKTYYSHYNSGYYKKDVPNSDRREVKAR